MKKIFIILMVSLALTGSVLAGSKTYQVTGPILEITDTTIVIQKGKEKWEIEKNSATKIAGELKKGAKVTVFYSMTATDIEAK